MKKIMSLLVFLTALGIINTVNAEEGNAKLKELQRALEINPDDVILLIKTGLALEGTGKYTEAEPLYLRSLMIGENTFGQNHPLVAASLNNLAELYRKQGKYEQAEPFYQRSLAIWERAFGQNHPNVATSLNNLSLLYEVQGKYKESESLKKRSLATREKALGQDHPDVAASLNNLAELYRKQGKYEQAEPFYKRSLTIWENTLGPDHPNVATSLNNLAVLYDAQSKYTEAEPLFIKSISIWEKISDEDHPNLADSLNNLAELYQKQGKYEQAEPFYKRSLTIWENTLGPDHPRISVSLNNLAALYEAQGKHEQAESFYKRSLTILEKALGQDHSDVAVSLNNLAELYRTQGKYELAEPFYHRSLAIWEKTLGPDHPNVATSLSNLAVLYESQGKYEQSELLKKRSLAIREKTLDKDHPDIAVSLNNLAELYRTQGKYELAEPFYHRSLAIWEKTLGPDHPNVATSLNNLALLYEAQGNYEQAELLYKRSSALSEKALSQDHPVVATSLNNLAMLYEKQGKHEKAEPLFHQSLAIFEKTLGQDHPNVAVNLDNLALFYFAQDAYEEAESFLQKSLRTTNHLLERWLWGAGEKTRQSYLQHEKNLRNIYLSFYSLRNTPEEAFYYSLSRKGLLLRIASEASTLATQSPDIAIQNQLQEFKTLRTQISNLFFSGKADKQTIQTLEEKSNDLEMQLSQNVSGFKRSQAEITPEQVLEKFSSEQMLIDFLVYKTVDLKTRKYQSEQVVVLIADKQNGIQLIKLGDLAPIATAIKAYQTAIVPTDDNLKTREQTLKQTTQILYQQLWQPLTPYLQDKTTVYLIPDGVLHLLPFKALQDKDGHYLAEKLQLITLSSARDIVLPPLADQASAAAIFAAPDYGDDTIATENTTHAIDLKNIYFKPLASALNEGQQIDHLFKKKQPESPTRLFLKTEATEQAVTASTSPKILHIATHGFFLEDSKPDEKALEYVLMRSLDQALPFTKIENPLTRSGLAFVGANLGVKGIKQADGSDGILTALEVLNLDLVGTDLVTLSACDTGKGDVKIGEGVYSLNRAFQEAGAKAVLSTLWKVSDVATAEFMQKFYERFLDGKPAQQAIQETQNEFMRDEKHSDPFYWAGFVMMGKE